LMSRSLWTGIPTSRASCPSVFPSAPYAAPDLLTVWASVWSSCFSTSGSHLGRPTGLWLLVSVPPQCSEPTLRSSSPEGVFLQVPRHSSSGNMASSPYNRLKGENWVVLDVVVLWDQITLGNSLSAWPDVGEASEGQLPQQFSMFRLNIWSCIINITYYFGT
jgi:hypothetical protein